MNNKFLFSFLFILSGTLAYAQQPVPCATDELYHEAIIKNPKLLHIEDSANSAIRAITQAVVFNKAGTVRYIPVVFHVIHSGGFENISQDQIMDQIRILNEDFRKKVGTNGFSNDPLAADVELEFRLAQYDPNGNKSDGINRIYAPGQDTEATNAVKSLSYWNSSKYLNVWVVKSISSSMTGSSGTILGYAQFPFQQSSSPTTDGIVIRSDQVGSINTAASGPSGNQLGRTFTHEVGHWLGLYHTFQGGCVGGTSSDCATKGDYVCDTPPVAEASFGCNTGQNTCNTDVPDLPDMIKNYMDYSDGSCMNLFTEGQKSRVNASMTFRQGIFGSSPNYVQSLSYAGLNSDGTYINFPASTIKAPYSNGFESTNNGWRINNFHTPENGWQTNTNTGYSGSNSLYMRNFTNSIPGNYVDINSRDGFQSPEIDITTLANPVLEFYYAYAQKSTANNDSFTVRISNDFGMNEILLWGKMGADLSTSGLQFAEFTPEHEEWRKVSIDLSAYKTYKNARFRFELVNRRGNNIFFDDFTVRDGATGIDEQLKSELGFSVFPNPLEDFTTISFKLKEKTDIQISVIDVLGKEVATLIDSKSLEAGTHSIPLTKENLNIGMYFIRVNVGSSGFNHKLLIN